jgi:tripartite-type tricarboxylate transporter receptor subunit TctC
MRIHRRRFLRLGATAAALPIGSRIAPAQAYPARAVTLLVPLAAGSSVDVNLRALAKASQKNLGQPIVIENRPGAGTTLAPAQMATTARPDGYTISQVGLPVFRAPFLRKTSYDPVKDFSYIIGVIRIGFGVVVRNDAPWMNFDKLLAAAKAHPGKISYATPGAGTDAHITMQRVARLRGIDWVHVPFSGGGTNALLGGHVQVLAGGFVWAQHVDAGDFRLLVTFGSERTKYWPTVPTLKESGLEIVVDAAYGLAGPKGMDENIVAVLHDAFKKGMEDAFFVATVEKFGQEVFYLDSDAFRDFAMRQIEEQRRIVNDLGLKQD